MTNSTDNDLKLTSSGAWSVERRVKLTRQVSILSLFVSFFYIIFDFIFEVYEYVPYYTILLGGGTGSLYLLHYKRYTLAKISLMLSGLVILSIFASWETPETGIFMYFLVVAVGAVTLFGTEEKMAAVLIGVLSFSVFYVVYFSGWLPYERLELSQKYISTSFFINFGICMIALMTMVYYILSMSHKYERQMQDTQKNLISLTDELAESRNRFELAIKGSSAGIWDWDIIKDKLYASPLLAQLLEYPFEEIQHLNRKGFESGLHTEDRRKFKRCLRGHLEDRTPFKIECRFKKRNGDYIWVLSSGLAEFNEKGIPERMAGSMVDITERKKAEEKIYQQNEMLEKTNAELDRFVYSTSHDLKAPLSSILGLIRIVQLSKNEQEKERCMVMMQERIHILNGFIADIIDYSRNSRLEVARENVNLKKVVMGALLNLQFFAKSAKIRIEESNLDINFFADRGRLKIIINNILANAMKYHNLNQSDPYIKISALSEDQMIKIFIEDNGIGIEPTLQDKIFDMFFRATEYSEGSGLGLYIAREMADKLKGKIEVSSQLNKGSRFIISFPEDIAN